MAKPRAGTGIHPTQLAAEASWDDLYRSGRELDLPWFSPTIDEEFDMALEHYSVLPKGGPVLDLGTGPGTAATELAKRNYEVVALDISPYAIKMAKRRAGALAKQIKWVCEDALDAQFEPTFQLVYDRGLYHSLDDAARAQLPARVASWIKPRGLLFLKCFSPTEPGDYGPHRIAEDEVKRNFAAFFDLIKVEHTTFPSTLDRDPKANFFVLRRRAGERSIA